MMYGSFGIRGDVDTAENKKLRSKFFFLDLFMGSFCIYQFSIDNLKIIRQHSLNLQPLDYINL